jgi:DNA-binding XRE family transcriptional regulator
MNSAEAIAARETLELSQEELAADLNLTPAVISAWEAGTVRIPRRYAEQLRFQVAATERQAAVAASGLPECEWNKAWQTEIVPDDLKAQTDYLQRGMEHRSGCPECVTRDKFVAERFGAMPPMPMPAWVKVFGALNDRIDTLPRWAQPAAWVGLGFGAYSLFRILIMLPRLAGNRGSWPIALQGLALSVSMGIAIGLTYGAFRALKEKLSAKV